jgi:hypothetical protein
MKLTFTLGNKEFEDTLAVSVNGKTKDLTTKDKQVSFDAPNTDKIEVHVEYKRNDIQQIKNPIGRFFAYLFFLLLSPIIFFADNDNGIGIHKFFYDAKPFDVKKIFKIVPTENVVLKFISPKYDKTTKRFLNPNIEVVGEEMTNEVLCSEYNQASFKKEFRLYHYPAYAILFAIIFALTVLMAVALINQFSPFDLFGVIGMSFCCVVMLALLIVFICLFVSTHRLFRQIDRNLSKDLREKQEI